MRENGKFMLMLETLQAQTFLYFLKYLNPENGLIADKSDPVPIQVQQRRLGISYGG
jgi:hypothetical protein